MLPGILLLPCANSPDTLTKCAGPEAVDHDTNTPVAPFPRTMWALEKKPGLGCMKPKTSQWKILPITKNVKL